MTYLIILTIISILMNVNALMDWDDDRNPYYADSCNTYKDMTYLEYYMHRKETSTTLAHIIFKIFVAPSVIVALGISGIVWVWCRLFIREIKTIDDNDSEPTLEIGKINV